MFVATMHLGQYKHAIYKCDDCGHRYNVFGMIDGPEFIAWCEPYNAEFCYLCFPKHPEAEPIFSRLETA